MNPIPVLMVTYNRLEYSKKALESITHAPGLPIDLFVWDNASTDGTQDWLREQCARAHPNTRAFTIHASIKNVGLAPAMNHFFRLHADKRYVVKVDNDTILPPNWLADLMEVMEARNDDLGRYVVPQRLGAVSGTCLRPNGMTAAEWYASMKSSTFASSNRMHRLYWHTYILGTGVLINMDMIRERGLLFEHFPAAPDTPLKRELFESYARPVETCRISGWTAYIREASEFEDWKFCFYDKVPVTLQNLKADHVLSNDYPEYDAEIAKARDEGNAWWESVGHLAGVRKYVRDHGGLERLPGYASHPAYAAPVGAPKFGDHAKEYKSGLELPTSMMTNASMLEYRATPEFWTKRIAEHGVSRSTFLSTPQARINEFTEHHMKVLKRYAPGKDVLDVGCGWGRISQPLSLMAKSYIGIDFMPALIDKAKESLPDLDFRVASATALPFEDGQFDVVVAVTCLSSFAAVFEQVHHELKRVLRPDGLILFLEEDYARIDWKLVNS